MKKNLVAASLVCAAVAGLAAALPARGETPAAPPQQGAAPLDACAMGPAMDASALGSFDPARARLIVGALLAAQETAIGITPAQLPAWRAYTVAVIGLLPTGERLAQWQEQQAKEPRKPFAVPEAIADAILAKADRARKLKEAVTALRAALTPEQLKLAELPQERLMGHLGDLIAARQSAMAAPPPGCGTY
ncbi:hypothetical protein [Azorhizobium doebereinerae]|uniref:hypothetical protein n=1 Tax=Azorhizobium doebereinerae TaxID=281091 RepID=UPI000687C951|nr:hypothetical protein [Azorhizobium doebereinerae]